MKRPRQIVFAFFLLFALISCGESEVDRASQAKEDVSSEVSVQTSKKDEAKTLVKDRDYYKEWMPTAPMEDLDDAEQWNDFRLQFIWIDRADRSNYQRYLLSMKFDGTDIRMAASTDLLFGELNASFHHFLRSPDNRYFIALFDLKYEKDFIAIVDLKSRTKKILEAAPLKPRFAWTPDSKFVYYYADKGLMKYDVETGVLKTAKKDVNSSGLYPLLDGNIVRIFSSGGYTLVNENGDSLFQAPWPDNKSYFSNTRVGVSPNLKYIYAFDSSTTCVYDLSDYRSPMRQIFCAEDFAGDDMGMSNTALIQPTRKGVEIFPFTADKPYAIAGTEMMGAQSLRVINRQLGDHESPMVKR